MAAVNAYSNMLDTRERDGMALMASCRAAESSAAAEKTQRERRSPVELQLSEVEELLEHNTATEGAGGPAWGSTSSGGASEERDDNAASTAAATEEEEEEEEETCSSDTMTEEGGGAGGTASSTHSPTTATSNRRSSIADGIWACLSPMVASLWRKGGRNGRESARQGEQDAFEVAFADIKQLEFVGSGAQGAVFSGEYRGEMVAVKKVKDKSYCAEISQLRKLSHKNIVQFRGVCTRPPCYCVVMEYCPQGNLYDYIRSESEILPPQVVYWARQIADGMLYLHSKKIIHRDLKSLNILMCDNDSVKISDFGTSRTIGDNSTRMTFAGTVAWMAPEMLRHEPCSEKVDVWSYGVLLWEMLTQEKPYNVNWREEIEAHLSKIREEGLTPPQADEELVQQREEELKHAQDVRQMYEQRLRNATRLYRRLSTCKKEIDAKEQQLLRREEKLHAIMQKMKRHDQQASRTVLESSDSTDDIDRFPPSHPPHFPPPHLTTATSAIMQKMKRHDQQASRTVLESSDSTDDIDRFPPSHPHHFPLLPPPHLTTATSAAVAQDDKNKSVRFGTPPTSRKKTHHARRKKRCSEKLSPEREPHPLTTPTHQVPEAQPHPPTLFEFPEHPTPPPELKTKQKAVPTNLKLMTGVSHIDRDQQPLEGVSKSSEDSLEPPITPGGSLSPAVDELIRSLCHRPPSSSLRERTHRRTGSGGGGGSGGSPAVGNLPSCAVLPGRASSSPAVVTSSPENVMGSEAAMTARRTTSTMSPLSPSHGTGLSRQQLQPTAPSLIPYSKLDSSDSDSDTDTFQDQSNSNHSGSSVLTRAVLKPHHRESQLLLSSVSLPRGQRSTTPTNHHHQEQQSVVSESEAALLHPSRGGAEFSASLSNESSCDITGTDGHDADSESDCAETESTTDDHYPTTTTAAAAAATATAKTTSNSLSLSPTLTYSTSPRPQSSAGTSSSDHCNTSPLSSLGSPLSLSHTPHSPLSPSHTSCSPLSPAHTPRHLSQAPTHTSTPFGEDLTSQMTLTREADLPTETTAPRGEEDEDGVCDSSTASRGQVAMLISHFEEGIGEPLTAGAATVTGSSEDSSPTDTLDTQSASADVSDSPKLEIPLHIRRRQHPTNGSYSPVQVEQALSLLQDSGLGNSMSILRHFYENIVSKGLPEEVGMHRTYSTTELEDSGFQSPLAGAL